jgi:hypothetical protein
LRDASETKLRSECRPSDGGRGGGQANRGAAHAGARNCRRYTRFLQTHAAGTRYGQDRPQFWRGRRTRFALRLSSSMLIISGRSRQCTTHLRLPVHSPPTAAHNPRPPAWNPIEIEAKHIRRWQIGPAIQRDGESSRRTAQFLCSFCNTIRKSHMGNAKEACRALSAAAKLYTG